MIRIPRLYFSNPYPYYRIIAGSPEGHFIKFLEIYKNLTTEGQVCSSTILSFQFLKVILYLQTEKLHQGTSLFQSTKTKYVVRRYFNTDSRVWRNHVCEIDGEELMNFGYISEVMYGESHRVEIYDFHSFLCTTHKYGKEVTQEKSTMLLRSCCYQMRGDKHVRTVNKGKKFK